MPQLSKVLTEHSAALESGVTGLARITRRIDLELAVLALKVAEHEGTAPGHEGELLEEWLHSPDASRAAKNRDQ